MTLQRSPGGLTESHGDRHFEVVFATAPDCAGHFDSLFLRDRSVPLSAAKQRHRTTSNTVDGSLLRRCFWLPFGSATGSPVLTADGRTADLASVYEATRATRSSGTQSPLPGGPGGSLPRGSHRSVRAQLRHTAPQVTVSLREGRPNGRFVVWGAETPSERPPCGPRERDD